MLYCLDWGETAFRILMYASIWENDNKVNLESTSSHWSIYAYDLYEWYFISKAMEAYVMVRNSRHIPSSPYYMPLHVCNNHVTRLQIWGGAVPGPGSVGPTVVHKKPHGRAPAGSIQVAGLFWLHSDVCIDFISGHARQRTLYIGIKGTITGWACISNLHRSIGRCLGNIV